MGLAYIMPLAGEGGRPDNDLPGSRPGRPGRPDRPDNSLPTLPGIPDNGLPDGGTVIDLPSNPIALPQPPQLNPPPKPVWPGVPIYPLPPTINPPPQVGVIYPPLPPAAGSGKVLALVFISGVGARWTVLDTSLVISGPPTATPK
jgi:hypothetical protein